MKFGQTDHEGICGSDCIYPFCPLGVATTALILSSTAEQPRTPGGLYIVTDNKDDGPRF